MPVHTTTIDLAALLAEHLSGDVIAPGHPDYDSARRVWNGMIDRRPAVIARCADADDVATAVRFAHEHGLPLAVRGGGHNVAGTAVVDDGLVDRPLGDARRARRRFRPHRARAGRRDLGRRRRVTAPLGLRDDRAASSPRPASPGWRSTAASPTSAAATA